MTPEERLKRIRAEREAVRPLTEKEVEAKNLREVPQAFNVYGPHGKLHDEQTRAMQDPLLVGAHQNANSFSGEWDKFAEPAQPSIWGRFTRWLKNPSGGRP